MLVEKPVFGGASNGRLYQVAYLLHANINPARQNRRRNTFHSCGANWARDKRNDGSRIIRRQSEMAVNRDGSVSVEKFVEPGWVFCRYWFLP